MKDLLAKLEEAECGNRDLDAQIGELHGALGWAGLNRDRPMIDGRSCPFYTTSIDAALSIVPAGWVYSIADRGSQGGLAILAPDILGRGISAKAKTVELAICSAALRARALM